MGAYASFYLDKRPVSAISSIASVHLPLLHFASSTLQTSTFCMPKQQLNMIDYVAPLAAFVVFTIVIFLMYKILSCFIPKISDDSKLISIRVVPLTQSPLKSYQELL
ncbi:hypothetical protein PRIPAC_89212 [Pristionchus pacificus]|uniref:Uncharacterized protein n=1 Tax=Pristionchus pacificus TaxID=54126 RepID=A0A2A6CWH3_PRIPA|nr:hypothetical protein PRIPAC_89212 [Pristionchus pacificus]|eukprot:PDM82440.1 hypothetical protein PRIPAC_36833 [Pristionchus pacificus]